jgi:hypothetical protein
MADGVFNIAKGAAAQLLRDNPDSVTVLLLQASEIDGVLVDHVNVADMLAAEGNIEATFTNYARKTGLSETITVDNTNDLVRVSIPNQTWTAAGNGTNNTLVKVVMAVAVGSGDANLIPLTHQDIGVTTNGTDLDLQFHADGFYSSA